jgi:ribosome-associated protein
MDNSNFLDQEIMSGYSNKNVFIIKLREDDDYIKLGQAMKAAALVYSGVEAKEVIQSGYVTVNDEVEKRRGRKLYDGDFLTFKEKKVKIEK